MSPFVNFAPENLDSERMISGAWNSEAKPSKIPPAFKTEPSTTPMGGTTKPATNIMTAVARQIQASTVFFITPRLMKSKLY